MFTETIARYRAFYAASHPSLMGLIRVQQPGSQYEAGPDLSHYDWSNPTDVEDYVRLLVEPVRHYRQNVVPGLDDDNMHTIQVLIGVGAIGGSFCDGAVRFEKDTSYLDPVIQNYDTDMNRVFFSDDNPWIRAQLSILRELVRQWDGTYTILPFTHFDPLDLANQLRGNDIMTDFYECPENVHLLLDRCADMIIGVERLFRSSMDGYDLEGTGMNCWIPAGTYLSCDLADLISRDVFMEFGRPYLQKLVDVLGGGYLHHHELGVHQIPSFTSVRGLSVQFLNRDLNTRHLPYVIDDEIVQHSLKLPIYFVCTFPELVERIDVIRQGKFVVDVETADYDEAVEALKLIRKYSP